MAEHPISPYTGRGTMIDRHRNPDRLKSAARSICAAGWTAALMLVVWGSTSATKAAGGLGALVCGLLAQGLWVSIVVCIGLFGGGEPYKSWYRSFWTWALPAGATGLLALSALLSGRDIAAWIKIFENSVWWPSRLGRF